MGNAHSFTASTSHVFANLHAWGWITVILGPIQLTAGFSLLAGNAGKVVAPGLDEPAIGESSPDAAEGR